MEHLEHKKTMSSNVAFDSEEVSRAINKYTPLTRQDFDISVIENWIEIKTKNPPKRRCNHLSFIFNGQIFIIGGRDINKGKIEDCYYLDLNSLKDGEDMQWEKLYSNDIEALSNNAGDIVGNCYYIFGGENKDSRATNSLYIYNIGDDSWQKRAFSVREIPAMIGHTCNYHISSSMFIVFGGFYNGIYSNEVYNYDGKLWSKLSTTNAPIGRIYHTTTLVDDYLYVFGGETLDGVYLNDLWKYDIKVKNWIEIQPVGEVPKQRAGHSCIHYNGCLYIFGGKISNIQERNEFWKYDINRNAFELIHDTLIEQRSFETIENVVKKSTQP
jgi:N-acetylneuraminic acid mutarotase